MKRNLAVFRLTTSGLLIALSIILQRIFVFPQGPTFYRISLANVPIVFASLLLGPLYGGIVGAISDFVGATVIPSGTFFIWPFLSATLYGVLPFLILHLIKLIPEKIKLPLFYMIAIAFYIFVVVYVFKNSNVMYGRDFENETIHRLEFSTLFRVLFVLVLTLIGVGMVTALIVLKIKNNRSFDNKITSSLVNLSFALFITHLILDLLYATIWKHLLWGIDFGVSVFFHSAILLILVPLESFVLSAISKPLNNSSITRFLDKRKND